MFVSLYIVSIWINVTPLILPNFTDTAPAAVNVFSTGSD